MLSLRDLLYFNGYVIKEVCSKNIRFGLIEPMLPINVESNKELHFGKGCIFHIMKYKCLLSITEKSI